MADNRIPLGKEAERFIMEAEKSELKAKEKFWDFCSSLGGDLFFKGGIPYCKIIRPISRVDIQLVMGKEGWIAEFVGLESVGTRFTKPEG